MNTDEIRKQIENAIKKTEALISEYEELTKPIAPDVAIGRVSRMDAINNKSINEAALRQAKEKLNKLKFALTKVGTPAFGTCAQCGKSIPVGRILLKPESPYCVRCAR